jgi:hypothetical protein
VDHGPAIVDVPLCKKIASRHVAAWLREPVWAAISTSRYARSGKLSAPRKPMCELYVRISDTTRSGRLSMLVDKVKFPDGIGVPVNQALLRAQLPLCRIETSAEGTSGPEVAVVEAPFAASLWQSVPKDGARRVEASAMST